MDREAIEARLREVLGLKALPRSGWGRLGVREVESVAAHSWGVAWLVMALCPPDVDRGRALAIAVLHDLAEARVGDITPHDGVPKAEKARREAEAYRDLVAPLPHAAELWDLWREYEDASTPEGRFVKACDKLDMALQARVYAGEQDIDTSELVQAAVRALDDPTLRALAAG